MSPKKENIFLPYDHVKLPASTAKAWTDSKATESQKRAFMVVVFDDARSPYNYAFIHCLGCLHPKYMGEKPKSVRIL